MRWEFPAKDHKRTLRWERPKEGMIEVDGEEVDIKTLETKVEAGQGGIVRSVKVWFEKS